MSTRPSANIPGAPHHDQPEPVRTVPQSLYYEAPTYYQRQPVDPAAVILLGGITNSPNWQPEAIEYFRALPDPVVILNPRRAHFPIDDPTASWEQYCWEQHHMHMPNTHAMIWYPATDPAKSTQPIVWGELGLHLGAGRLFTIGCDPGYARIADVRMWCQYHRPGLTVHTRLDHLLEDTADHLDQMRRPRRYATGV